MRQHPEIDHRIGIGGKRTGVAVFLGLALAIGLVWAVQAYLDGRKKDYQDRIVGALKFLNWTLAASQEIEAELYRPALKPGLQANRWVLSGVMVVRDDTADQPRDRGEKRPFFADLHSVCANPGNPSCWRLSRLVVDGQALIGSPAADSADDDPGPSQETAEKIDAGASQDGEDIAGTGMPRDSAADDPSPSQESAEKVEAAAPQDYEDIAGGGTPQDSVEEGPGAPQEKAEEVDSGAPRDSEDIAGTGTPQDHEDIAGTDTPQDPAPETAARIPVPKEPASRNSPEFPAAPWVTVARPQNGLPLAVATSPPCIDMDAWRDPDIARNRQLILDEPLCLSVIEFAENGLNWRVQVFDSGRPGYNWVVLHDDEDAAFDSGLYAIARYGGKVVDVDLLPPTPFDAFVDPNHNFAFVDAHRRTCDGPPRRAAPIFTTTIIKLLGSPPYLALHNNYDGHHLGGGGGNISVHHSTQGLFGLPAKMTGERLADEDNFILVSGLAPPDRIPESLRQTIDQLRYSGVNVIYEHVGPDTYDCSLSNFLLLHGGAEPGQYFNVESELGDLRSQITMIDALVGTLDSPLRVSH